MIDAARRPAFLALAVSPTFDSLSSPHTPPAPLTPILSFSPRKSSFGLESKSDSDSDLDSLGESFTLQPPVQPLPWLWSCHICNTRYPLGTTRRCLIDGHYFCAGETPTKKGGRKKRHRPCGSEFDYVGWTEYGEWRRGLKSPEGVWDGQGKNCGEWCNFPSECRWSKKLKTEERDTNNPRATMEDAQPDVDMVMKDAEEPPSTVDPKMLEKRDEPASTSNMLDKVVKSAEKRSAGLKRALLSSASNVDVTETNLGKEGQTPAASTGSTSLQRGLAKMAVICRIPETLYE